MRNCHNKSSPMQYPFCFLSFVKCMGHVFLKANTVQTVSHWGGSQIRDPLEEVFNLSLICVIETCMWVMMDIPIEVQIKLTNFHMKQSIQFMLEDLQRFSCAGTCRYRLKAKNCFCLAFVKIIFQSQLPRLNGAFIYALAIPVTLVKLLLT